MSEERLEELREILHNPNLKGYLANVCNELLQELRKTKNIIKEVREEVKIYEEQSKDGITNELDNYVFVQRLKKVLDKEVN